MTEQKGPGIISLLVYLVAGAGLAGGMAGWIHSSGAADWARTLQHPAWTPNASILTGVGVVMPAFIVIALWIAQRGGRDGWRFFSSIKIVGLLAGILLRTYVYYGSQDVVMGFVATLALWVYDLFTVGVVQRCCRPSGVLLWFPFAWITYLLIHDFEVMRLYNDATFAGGGL